MSSGVYSGADGAVGGGGGPCPFVLEAAGKFCIKEGAIPEFHNGASAGRRDVGLINVALGVGEEMFLCVGPCVMVDSFDGGGVPSFGEAAYVVVEVDEGVCSLVRPVNVLVGGGVDGVE